MFFKALAAFLVLPGVFALAVPWMLIALDPFRGQGSLLGALALAAGLATLFRCVVDFYVSGRGTLAPWDPPKHLVVTGLYRHTRNPMYIGVLVILAGWAITFASPVVAGYLAVMGVMFHLRVRHYEEPLLAAEFGSDWRAYVRAVPRWLPRLRPWTGKGR